MRVIKARVEFQSACEIFTKTRRALCGSTKTTLGAFLKFVVKTVICNIGIRDLRKGFQVISYPSPSKIKWAITQKTKRPRTHI